jgi:cytochrome P450
VGEFNDLLDILLKYQAENGGDSISDENIVFTCWDMFIAGHETTART